jgi:predicted HD phosphohydrolase
MLLEGDCGGFPVDRLTHCLQTATLAHQDGKDEEYVVCALLHDIGDTLGPQTTRMWRRYCWSPMSARPTTGW